MKTIKNYINERLHVTTKSHAYTFQPKDRGELVSILIERLKKDGLECDLNDIDVSNITNMSHLFDVNYYNNTFKDFNKFNCDVSQWDVSNVEDMTFMFNGCEHFNCDISEWDVSSAKFIDYMFSNCKCFRQNLDNWDVSNVSQKDGMFVNCHIKEEYKPKFKK